MPIYVYRNLVTNETFEVEQRITEDALTTDPRSGDPVKRLIQPVGIAFKGSGFYVNDSRGSTKGGAKGASASAGGSSPSDGVSGSEGASSTSDKAPAAAAGASGSSGGSSATTTTPAAS